MILLCQCLADIERPSISIIFCAFPRKEITHGLPQYPKRRLNLDPRIHRLRVATPRGTSCTLEEVLERFGGNERRNQLLTGLVEALRLLRAAVCRRVYINGSF